MNNSITFQRSLRRLAAPFTLAAVALVLVNDWALRPLHPSWLTGKLSDLGSLFFAPYLLAGLFGFLLPAWLGRRPRLAGGLAYGVVLAGFVLLKLSPTTNAWLVGFSRSAGFPLRAVPDPTDLLALPALAVSAWLWFRPARQPVSVHPLISGKMKYLLIPLASLVLIADAAAPDYGIHCFIQQGDTIQAPAGYGSLYASKDGGMTWTTVTPSGPPDSCQVKSAGTRLDLTGDSLHYQVVIGQSVQWSMDNKTWLTLYQAAPLGQAERTYLLRTRTGNLLFNLGPLDALVDPRTGNLVLAMGQDGVLVAHPASSYPIWVPVAGYRHNELPQSGLGGVMTLLALELWLAAGAALLWLSTAALRRRSARWQVALTVIGWLLFALAALVLHPDFSASSEIAVISVMILLAALVWTLALAIIALVRHSKTGLARFAVLAALTPLVWLLFMVPYLLWGYQVLPDYWYAVGLSALILVGASVAAYRLF